MIAIPGYYTIRYCIPISALVKPKFTRCLYLGMPINVVSLDQTPKSRDHGTNFLLVRMIHVSLVVLLAISNVYIEMGQFPVNFLNH